MYTKDKLKSGITIVTEDIPYVNSVSIGVWIANGSRNENKYNNGISHLIEHMLFKGTPNRSARKIAEDIEGIGGQINAFTGKEATCFYVKVLDEHIDIAIDVLSDMLQNSTFKDEDLTREKGVISEEINMYEDSPEDLVLDLLSQAMWPDTSIGYPILGTFDTLKSIGREMIIKYMKDYYTADNTVVSVTGNFDREHLIKMLEMKFKNLERKGKIPQYDKPELNNSVLYKAKDIEQIHLSLGLPGIEIGNDDLYTLLIINNIFGGGTSSRLFQVIREEKGLAYSIYSYPSSYKNTGAFSIYAGLNPKYIAEVVKLIREEIEKMKITGINEEQLKKSKEQLKGNYILGLESISGRMFGMGKSELLTDKIYEPKEIVSKIDHINIDDVNRVIKNIFGRGIISAAAVGKLNKHFDLERILVQ
ncbi:MAG: pitrilysin family protein [Clostridiales bacterium]|nr:pitrilysin family protein [Clostridiales bacterium]HBM81227.1 peptidase M16 [Clostridiaceae bacterium]